MLNINYHEIVSLDDKKYDDWLDLYQIAFPISEQMKISSLNQMLRQKHEKDAPSSHFLIAQDEAASTAAIAMYEDDDGCGVVPLWYIAVMPDNRSKGIGTQVYQEIRRRVGTRESVRMLIMEVEDPEMCHSYEDRILAFRRIEFYRRNGAKRLGGISYVQSVGWQPPIPMHLMVDLLREQSDADVLAAAQNLFGNALQPIDKPKLI